MMDDLANGKLKKNRIFGAVVFLCGLSLLAAAYWFFWVRGTVYSDDARIDGDLVDIAPQVPGVLTQVQFKAGDQVASGALLFVLDKNLLQAAEAKADADVISARADWEIARAQYRKAINGPLSDEIRIAETAVEKAEAEEKLAAANWTRFKPLFEQHVVTKADRDREETAWITAKRRYDEAKEHLSLLEQGTRSEDLAAAKSKLDLKKADLASAEAKWQQARINLAYAEVRAPFAGVVVRRWRDPGAMLNVGTPVMTLLNPASLHVAANIDEKYLGRVGIGDAVDISLDAYPDVKLKGQVEKILRATNSKFSLIPAEGVSGTFIKVAQRVPLKIAIKDLPNLPLGPGLSAEIRIKSHSGAGQPQAAALHE